MIHRIRFMGMMLMVLALASAAGAAEPVFRLDQGVLTIRTDRYEVAWRNGNMVGLTSFLPQRTPLTIESRPMEATQMPTGLGSFFEQREAGHQQHHPWQSKPLTATWPAQHPPDAQTQVDFERIENGARLTYRGLAEASGAVLVQELTVDPDTGDLVIRQHGQSENPGLFGIAFNLLNLRPDIDLIVPYFNGQYWRQDFRPNRVTTIAWPHLWWNAAIVIGQNPGDTEGGTFAVWGNDEQLRPKFFRRHLDKDEVLALGFEANVEPPYDERREIEVATWRFNTFAGSWMEPAQRYKDWMIQAYDLRPRSERASDWVKDIALIWMNNFRNESQMKAMAENIDPKHVLIHDFRALDGFNRRIPEYDFGEGIARGAALAHEMGYHVGVYTSLGLIDQETHPTMMADYGLEYLDYKLWRDDSQYANEGRWLVYVHPGSDQWLEFYVGKMVEVVEKYDIDYLYQDVTGITAGGSGLIDGRNFHQGVVAVERALRERLPERALGGEFWNEVSAIAEDFANQAVMIWGGAGHKAFITRPDQPHPIVSFLVSDYCLYFDYRVPFRSEDFHPVQNVNEVVGALPTWLGSPEDHVGEARAVLERARLFAEGFRPSFPEDWAPQAVAYMRNEEGRMVRYDRPEASTYCYEETPAGDQLRYARVTGRSRVDLPEPTTIDGWIGYDESGPIGLDPQQWYCVFPGEPPVEELPLVITRLPEGAPLKFRLGEGYAVVEVEGSGGGEIGWRSEQAPVEVRVDGDVIDDPSSPLNVELPARLLFVYDQPRTPSLNQVLSLEEWQIRYVNDGMVLREAALDAHKPYPLGEETHYGYLVQPPLGGIGSEISIDGLVRIPDDPAVALKTHLGRLGGIGDGVHFVVRVNGQEVWRHKSPSPDGRAWTQEAVIPLGDYAGQAVVLSLAVDCGTGGFNTSNDQSIWGDPQFVKESDE